MQKMTKAVIAVGILSLFVAVGAFADRADYGIRLLRVKEIHKFPPNTSISVEDPITFSGSIAQAASRTLTPSTVTGAATVLGVEAGMIIMEPSSAHDLTLTAGVSGQVVTLFNNSAGSTNITLLSAAATHRFNSDIVLSQYDSITLAYLDSKWSTIASSTYN